MLLYRTQLFFLVPLVPFGSLVPLVQWSLGSFGSKDPLVLVVSLVPLIGLRVLYVLWFLWRSWSCGSQVPLFSCYISFRCSPGSLFGSMVVVYGANHLLPRLHPVGFFGQIRGVFCEYGRGTFDPIFCTSDQGNQQLMLRCTFLSDSIACASCCKSMVCTVSVAWTFLIFFLSKQVTHACSLRPLLQF